MSVRRVAMHHFKSPSLLTPYEEKLWEKYNQGLNYKQITESLGYKNADGVRSRIKLIKDKLRSAGELGNV